MIHSYTVQWCVEFDSNVHAYYCSIEEDHIDESPAQSLHHQILQHAHCATPTSKTKAALISTAKAGQEEA